MNGLYAFETPGTYGPAVFKVQATETLWTAMHAAASLPSDTVKVIVGVPAVTHVYVAIGDVGLANEPELAVQL